MSFRLSGGDDGQLNENHEINVTPFIDVMLVLLIIFMVAAPLATVSVPVDLPTSTASPQPPAEDPLYLSVLADLSLTLGEEQQLDLASLPAALAVAAPDTEQRIFLRADKGINYGDLTEVINALGDAGYLKIALFWLVAALVGICLHATALAIYLWQPVQTPQLQPRATPMVIELAMPLAAPPSLPNELPPGPEQTESSAAKAPPAPVENSLPVQPEVAEAEVSLPDKKPQPADSPEPPAEEAPEGPQEPVNESDDQNAAPQTSAPPSITNAQPSETVGAPTVGAASQQDLDARQQWQQLLYAHLERHKRYPRQALRANQRGMPVIALTMDRNGQVLEVELVRSSGARPLDREALSLGKRAEPLPLPPPQVRGDPLTISIPIAFTL